MSAVGSDMGAGLAICLCPVIVGHFFGNQALPLSILSFPALNRTLRGWGGLNLEAWALQPLSAMDLKALILRMGRHWGAGGLAGISGLPDPSPRWLHSLILT